MPLHDKKDSAGAVQFHKRQAVRIRIKLRQISREPMLPKNVIITPGLFSCDSISSDIMLKVSRTEASAQKGIGINPARSKKS